VINFETIPLGFRLPNSYSSINYNCTSIIYIYIYILEYVFACDIASVSREI